MTLLYDSFGIRRVEVVANFWPDIDRLIPGDLSKLFAVLNEDDLFTSSELRPEIGARFEGEHWTYDLSLSSVMVRCTSYATPEELRARMRRLLEGTREYFAERQRLAFYSDDVRVGGFVPEDKSRNVGQVVQRRLLSRVKVEDREQLPGLTGAGLRLVGDAENYHWHGTIEPPHGAYSTLYVGAQLMFFPEPAPPEPGPDLDSIDEQIVTAYEFVNNHLLAFASKLFT